MLTNLESLPLARIHNMLKMFVPASGADRGCRDRAEIHAEIAPRYAPRYAAQIAHSPANKSRHISRRIRYDRSEPELQRFLNRLVEDGKLESAAGQYKIKRS